jgi:GrpB-like predicted nucleotidyltransferase (UPF0157 family)
MGYLAGPDAYQEEAAFVADDLEAYLGEVLIGGLEPGAIVLTAYDPAWAARYDREAAIIRRALGVYALGVEHIGSTAVPGLLAKPIIDILVVVADSSREETYLPALEAAGYVLRVREPAFHEHRMLRTPAADVHVHVYSAGSAEIARMLRFRDHLRQSESDRDAYASAKRGLASRSWKSMQYYAEAKTPVIERILARREGGAGRDRLVHLILPALAGLLVFAYQVPLRVVNPLNIEWMMKADRAAMLSGWLFERNEPWTMPFGILHTMMAPLVTTVGYSDALPWIAVPAKLFFGWVQPQWQYAGLFLLASYALQAVFGYLVLRAMGIRRGLSLAGSAFFAASPALLHRFEHVSLSAHWQILAAWWLYLRRPPEGEPSWRFLAPWLVLLAVTIPTYAYLAVMVAALAGAAYVRALWIDRRFSLWTAAWHGGVTAIVIWGVFWVFGYFVLASAGEPGFGLFSADVLAFFNPAGFSRFLGPMPLVQRGYENFYYLGLGLIALIPVAAGLEVWRSRRTPGARSAGAWPTLWPAVAVVTVMFVYALSSPVRLAGHALFSVPLYAHLPHFTMWFRGSGRFAWPLYYLVMALTLAAVARSARPWLAFLLLAAAFALQLADVRKLRAVERRDYEWPWPRLEWPVWTGLGHSFRSVRLVPPIVANRVACARYGRNFDWEIRFGVMAARERMTFNSSNPARVDSLSPLCRPMLDSLRSGLLDPTTVYIPNATYREAIEWWARGRVVCGTVEEADVCVARPTAQHPAPLTRLLLAQEPTPPPTVLHFDLRGDDAGFVDSTTGFVRGDSGGRLLTQPIVGPTRASVFFSRPLTGPVTLVVEGSAVDSLAYTPITVTLGAQTRRLIVGASVAADTLRFVGTPGAQVLQFTPAGDPPPQSALGVAGGMFRTPAIVRIRRLTIGLE